MHDVAVVVVTDGRPYLRDTLASAEEFLFPYCSGPTILVSDVQHRRGLSGAVREAWQKASHCPTKYLFHLEDDWVFREPVPVGEMIELLNREQLVQVALKRDPAPHERAVGGFMQLNPHNYVQRGGWVESFFGFTLNPCLYRNHPLLMWPEGGGEREYSDLLTGARFGIYGNLDDPPRCFHIGHQRSAGWKL